MNKGVGLKLVAHYPINCLFGSPRRKKFVEMSKGEGWLNSTCAFGSSENTKVAHYPVTYNRFINAVRVALIDAVKSTTKNVAYQSSEGGGEGRIFWASENRMLEKSKTKLLQSSPLSAVPRRVTGNGAAACCSQAAATSELQVISMCLIAPQFLTAQHASMSDDTKYVPKQLARFWFSSHDVTGLHEERKEQSQCSTAEFHWPPV
ncbi:hypothetical protein C8R43DRAFT_1112150 [Mycena crocata]|nr:hypothetical protein C8R43DRAFT_1112150 [Mycena crocata]